MPSLATSVKSVSVVVISVSDVSNTKKGKINNKLNGNACGIAEKKNANSTFYRYFRKAKEELLWNTEI